MHGQASLICLLAFRRCVGLIVAVGGSYLLSRAGVAGELKRDGAGGRLDRAARHAQMFKNTSEQAV
eukprot:2408862-Alexandrium_andersonii.AAC.1